MGFIHHSGPAYSLAFYRQPIWEPLHWPPRLGRSLTGHPILVGSDAHASSVRRTFTPSIFNLRSPEPKIEEPPSPIFGPEEWVEDRTEEEGGISSSEERRREGGLDFFLRRTTEERGSGISSSEEQRRGVGLPSTREFCASVSDTPPFSFFGAEDRRPLHLLPLYLDALSEFVMSAHDYRVEAGVSGWYCLLQQSRLEPPVAQLAPPAVARLANVVIVYIDGVELVAVQEEASRARAAWILKKISKRSAGLLFTGMGSSSEYSSSSGSGSCSGSASKSASSCS